MMGVVLGGELWEQDVQLGLHVDGLLPPDLRSFRFLAHEVELRHNPLNVDVKFLLGFPMIVLPEHPSDVIHDHLHFTTLLFLFLLLCLKHVILSRCHFQYLKGRPCKRHCRDYSVGDMVHEMVDNLVADFRFDSFNNLI